jgi:8-oxo-dGTP pyrophosphatase MutT (NUDIX family)
MRDEAEGGFSLFMVQRNMNSRFMPGAHVFPGGAVDPADAEAGEAAACRAGWSPAERAAAESGGCAIAHLAAAARELKEEAGVRLPDLRALVPFAHWITPAIETRRFDTWFLLARMPDGELARHDEGETVDSRWVRAADALRRYGDGEMILAPPTYYLLWDLARFATAAEALRGAAARRIVAVQPEFRDVDGAWCILLPGDPLHPSRDAMDGPTRIVMGDGGRWWVVAK